MQELRLQALRWLVHTRESDSTECIDRALELGLKPEHLRQWSSAVRGLEDTAEAILLAVGLQSYEARGALPSTTVLKDWVQRHARDGSLSETRAQAMFGILDAVQQTPVNGSEVGVVVSRLREEYKRHRYAEGLVAAGEKLNTLNPSEFSTFLGTLLEEVEDEGTADTGVYSLADVARDRWEHYERVEADPLAGRGFQLGWMEFDRRNNGLKPGELMVVVANTNVGKSAFQVRTLLNLWRQDGRRVMAVNREMTNRVQHARMEAMELSDLFRTDPNMTDPTRSMLLTRLNVGNLTEDEREMYQRLLLETYEQYEVPFWVVSPDAYSCLDDVASIATRYARKHGLEVLGADSLNLHHVRGAGSHDHWLKMGDNAELLKRLAVTTDIAVITDCQAKRETAGKQRVTVEDVVGYSPQIAQHADVLVRLYPVDDYELEVQVLKARDGDKDYSFRLYFNRENMEMEYAGP